MDVSSAAANPGADEDDYISFPYPVATVRSTGLGFRAIYKASHWQWVWHGVHAYCQLSADVYQWVKENKLSIQGYLAECLIPQDALHMGSEQTDFKWGTTMSSRALLLVLLSVGKRKKLQRASKVLAFKLVHILLGMALDRLDTLAIGRVSASLPFNGPGASADHWTVEFSIGNSGATTALHQASLHNQNLGYFDKVFSWFLFGPMMVGWWWWCSSVGRKV